MRSFSYTSAIIVIIVAFLYSCEHQRSDALSLETVCFEKEVLPVFQNKCAVCHNTSTPEGGYVFSDYTSIMKAIEPGNPEKSIAYKYFTKIIHEFMPPDEPLTVYERTIIRIWIEQGANETTCDNVIVVDTTEIDSSVCFSRDILPILLTSCAISGCHDNITQAEDVVLTDYTTIINNDEIIEPFDPLNSKIYEMLLETGEDQMPPLPASALTDEQIALFYEWINEGALDEECTIICDTSIYTYSEAIETIITNNCKGCHSGTAPSGGVLITNYNEVKMIADDGRLVDVINGSNGRPLMPLSGSLSDCQITQIEKWVDTGSPNN